MIEGRCCGMAGTFGLEAEHAEMASAMAERDLMPALRDKPRLKSSLTDFPAASKCASRSDTARVIWRCCCAMRWLEYERIAWKRLDTDAG